MAKKAGKSKLISHINNTPFNLRHDSYFDAGVKKAIEFKDFVSAFEFSERQGYTQSILLDIYMSDEEIRKLYKIQWKFNNIGRMTKSEACAFSITLLEMIFRTSHQIFFIISWNSFVSFCCAIIGKKHDQTHDNIIIVSHVDKRRFYYDI